MAKEIRELREEIAAQHRTILALVELTRPEGHDGPWWPLPHDQAPPYLWTSYA